MNRRGVTELNQGQLNSIICLSHLLPNSHTALQYAVNSIEFTIESWEANQEHDIDSGHLVTLSCIFDTSSNSYSLFHS